MEKTFKVTAYLEGFSFLLLLGIAMPMKYFYGDPTPVKLLGWVHGLLFMGYIGVLATISAQNNWSNRKRFLGVIAGVTPFGPFLFEKFVSETH